MTTDVRESGITREPATGTLAQALAERLEKGAQALATLASGLTESQWQARIPHDGRPIGVVVHHVANMYPLEIQLAQAMAAGKANIVDVVTAVAETEVAVDALVAVRDRVIQAYEEIMKMPI